MREIKFRVWDLVTNPPSMLGPFGLLDVPVDSSGGDYYLMQFTGLKDKNGVEIYEGDIVTGGVGGLVKPFLIKWSAERKWLGSADGYYKNNIGFNFDEYDFRLEFCEVIGNIHENPELINDH